MCLTSADSQNWCYSFALLSKEACVRGDTGSDNRVYITRSMWQSVLVPSFLTMKISLQNNMPQPEWVHQRLSTISVITLGLKMPSLSFSLLSGTIFIYATVIIWKGLWLYCLIFFFCTELWFCCWMQNNSQGWQTSGEPVLDINLWFSGKTHLKCKSCYWEHIVMIHHVNICLAA